MPFHTFRLSLLAALLLAVMPAESRGQTYWRFPMTVGYGGLGAGMGALSSPGNASYDDYGLRVIAGLAAGVVVGYVVGRLSDEALGRGEELGVRRRWMIRLGTVFAGASIGTIAGGVISRSDDPSPLGSDEAILVGSALTGAIAGGVLQYVWDSKLWPAATVQGMVSPDGPGRLALSVRIAH